MKILNSFSTTIFSRHRIQYESGAFGETDISNIFFFLPSIVDRIEEIINKYLGSVNLNAIDINIDKFGQNFDPSKLDVETTESENVRKSVLRVLKKIAEHSSQIREEMQMDIFPVYLTIMILVYGLKESVHKVKSFPCRVRLSRKLYSL